MRLHLLSLGAIALLGLPLAHADTFYNITLTSTQGYTGGAGSFALNVPPPSTGTVAYGFPGIAGFTPGDTIDLFTESYTPPPGGLAATNLSYGGSVQSIQFTNGTLLALNGFFYSGGGGSCQSSLYIRTTNYLYSESCFQGGGPPQSYSDAGTVTITPAAVGATPEPSGVVLLGTGMLGVVGVVRRRLVG